MDSILQSGRGGLICETKLHLQELELKMKGGAYARRGGVIAGYYGTMYSIMGNFGEREMALHWCWQG